MKRAARSALEVDVIVDSGRWGKTQNLETVVRRAVTRAAAVTRSTTAGELAIVLTDDSAIRALNRDWRGIDAATNVLSFPAQDANGRCPGRHLGDIVLAFETIAREARGEHKPLAHHVAHLAVHGFLHLVGYDHERDDDAIEMEQAERDILGRLAIPDPYRPKSRPKGGPKSRSETWNAAAGRTKNRAGRLGTRRDPNRHGPGGSAKRSAMRRRKP